MEHHFQFSERERQVIDLLLLGKSNKQIAAALGVSVRAVEFHLSNIYSKLGVASRTEAALKLSELRLRESTGDDLRESAGADTGELKDNVNVSISTRRSPVNKSFLTALAILMGTSLLCVVSMYRMAKERGAAQDEIVEPTSIAASTVIMPTDISTPAVSPKEHILEQVRQLVAEYEQTVQAEKKNGALAYSTDPTTGQELFLFQGDSYMKVWTLYLETSEQVAELTELYAQLHRDELNPTPFPTQILPEQNDAYLNQLYRQAETFCPANSPTVQDTTVLLYDPDDGRYQPIMIDEEMARCMIYGWMIEEWRTAPILPKVDQAADIAMIQQVMGSPGLDLKFQSISELPNAPWQSAAVYIDQTGKRYYVDMDAARLAAIEPNIPGHPDIAANEQKSMDELRGIARQFAFTYCPRLGELESVLLYEENCKGSICFFRWDYRNRDWSGTDWVMMPPFLQVGVLLNGEIVTYNNTLDLFE